MASNDRLHTAALLACARVQALGAAPLSEAMLKQCVLEAFQLERHLRNASPAIEQDGRLEELLARNRSEVQSEALRARLNTSLPNTMPDESSPRF